MPDEPKVGIVTKDVAGATHAILCFSGKEGPEPVNEGYKGHVKKLREVKFLAKAGEVALVDGIIFVGLGEKGKFKPRHARKIPGAAIGLAKALRTRSLLIDSRGLDVLPVKNLVYAAFVSVHKYEEFKTKEESKGKGADEVFPEEVLIFVSDGHVAVANEAKIVAESINFARDIANKPANVATPQLMAAEAKKLASRAGLGYKLITKKDMQRMGMNAFLAVASGSGREPTLSILEYRSPGAKKTLVVAGKGLTFDSGGISLKPSKGMEDMKFDKSGACAVLGIMKAVSEMRPKINVIGMVPCTENMPSGTAAKPGDIVRAYNGKTIEILNTDAEGRLVLADVLAYAERKYKPDYMIDIATLTGACVVALGSYAMGMFSNDDEFAEMLKKASSEGFDEVWHMPLWEEYSEMNKGKFADIANVTNTGEAGAVTAAAFLSSFVSSAKWVHLDIAGTAYRNKPIPPVDVGCTGSGVSVVLEVIKLIERAKH
ncbi:MAG: leucyl aminopeptidase [Candidatus Micrarchaeota archaeon]|nr:leucyl aminopeptidase [Candidatus Micrarchaeota archaeon]